MDVLELVRQAVEGEVVKRLKKIDLEDLARKVIAENASWNSEDSLHIDLLSLDLAFNERYLVGGKNHFRNNPELFGEFWDVVKKRSTYETHPEGIGTAHIYFSPPVVLIKLVGSLTPSKLVNSLTPPHLDTAQYSRGKDGQRSLFLPRHYFLDNPIIHDLELNTIKQNVRSVIDFCRENQSSICAYRFDTSKKSR